MKMKHNEVIEKLKNIDLTSYPYEDVKSLLRELGKVGTIITTLHKGKRMLRSRINNNSEHFGTIPELSFKPQEFNKTYQRASTQNKTMFYGSIVPEILGKTEPDTARITTLFELSEFVRATETAGTQKITFSVWEVIEDTHLVSLIHYKNFERPTELSKRLQEEFENFINKYPELKTSSLETTQFLGEQFAKPVEMDKDYNYLISAIYSELITEFGYDGVLYPSVKLAGEGVNIAVKPSKIGSKIKFVNAGECTIYKNKKRVFVGNDTYAVIDNSGGLKYVKAPDDVFTSGDFGMKQVGLK
jgi:hypothetical protein